MNEDSISQFASLVRQFGQAVELTHQEGTRHVAGLAAAYRSASSETMVDGWQKLSARHVTEILDGCVVLADALDAAAVYVTTQKGVALVQLIEMASAFIAAQAAAVETVGLSEAAVPVIIKAASKLTQSLIQDLQQYLFSLVVEAAMKPLAAKVEAALKGLDWSQSGAASPGRSTGFELDMPMARMHAEAMGEYAAQMRGHAQKFSAAIKGIQF